MATREIKKKWFNRWGLCQIFFLSFFCNSRKNEKTSLMFIASEKNTGSKSNRNQWLELWLNLQWSVEIFQYGNDDE